MTLWVWAAFLLFILAMLALDLGVFHRTARAVGTAEALAWSAFWIALALVFNGLVFFMYEEHWLGIGSEIGYQVDGRRAAIEFFTGYVVEKSLSLDNIFVIALIFSYFRVPLAYQHRVLFWGVLGALVLRGVMIIAGAALIARFQWTVYVFGGFLIFTAVKMLAARHDNLEPDKNPLVRLARRFFPVTSDFHGEHFFVEQGGRRAMTPLFLVLLVVESSDVLFAVDSIPAIFAITRDPFLVFTSNVFAILGLRSLYFALAPLLEKFRYLKFSLVFLLAFVGVKMLLSHHRPIPTVVSLAVIGGILLVGVLASVFASHRDTAPLASPVSSDLEHLTGLTLGVARRVLVLVLGSSVLVVGVAMILLPGPAVLVIPAGLAILASEFAWARRWLQRLRRELDGLADGVRNRL